MNCKNTLSYFVISLENENLIQQELLYRVVARYVGSGIKGLKQGGIRDHSLRIRDHGLGIGISAVVHRIRDQTDSVIMIKITTNLDFGFF